MGLDPSRFLRSFKLLTWRFLGDLGPDLGPKRWLSNKTENDLLNRGISGFSPYFQTASCGGDTTSQQLKNDRGHLPTFWTAKERFVWKWSPTNWWLAWVSIGMVSLLEVGLHFQTHSYIISSRSCTLLYTYIYIHTPNYIPLYLRFEGFVAPIVDGKSPMIFSFLLQRSHEIQDQIGAGSEGARAGQSKCWMGVGTGRGGTGARENMLWAESEMSFGKSVDSAWQRHTHI